MYREKRVVAIMPALNEEKAIGHVIRDLQKLTDSRGQAIVDKIIVCDNGSSDGTAQLAYTLGAQVVYQAERGYGIACLTAIEQIDDCDIVLFIDADNSCVPSQGVALIESIAEGYDLAIGSRALGQMQKGSLTAPQRTGNRIATLLIRLLWGKTVTDLGPFRAVSLTCLRSLHMQDRTFGWTVEMQIKAIQSNKRIVEHPVDSTRRIGKSKISGTLRGVLGAARGIIGTILKLKLQEFQRVYPRRNTALITSSPQSRGK